MAVSDKKATVTDKATVTETAVADLPAGYEAGVQELEALVAEMESGQLPLDALLSSYERGAQLLQFCRDRLAVLEQQVHVLEKGSLKPWIEEE